MMGAIKSESLGDFVGIRTRYKKLREQHYDSSNPYASLAAAAKAEYDAFALSRRELENRIAMTRDAQERQALALRKEIEAAEYMAITSHRLAQMSRDATGRTDNPEAIFQETKANKFDAQALALRQEYDELLAPAPGTRSARHRHHHAADELGEGVDGIAEEMRRHDQDEAMNRPPTR